MCGIVGYAGHERAEDYLLDGLKSLEYRGYDSAGIVTLGDSELNIVKCEGTLEDLRSRLQQNELPWTIGMGHTRWATHGPPSDWNSHPHEDCQGRFALVHNGIIENYREWKQHLQEKDHEFTSDTDTEVLVHLLEEKYTGDIPATLEELHEELVGSYAVAVMDREEPGKIYALRQDSPLVVGIGEGENFLASDIPALLDYTEEFYVLENGDMAVISRDEVEIFPREEESVEDRYFQADWDAEMVDKKGYKHYMLKEIHEQPTVARRFLSGRVCDDQIEMPELNEVWHDDIERVVVTACGTAYYSGLLGRHVIEELANLPVTVELGSELRYKENFLDENTLVIVVSQSGETADTLAALETALDSGARTLALTNTVSSSIARKCEAVVDIKAGPEIAVASTKAYLAMLLGFYLIALKLGNINGTLSEDKLEEYSRELVKLPDKIESVLNRSEDICRHLAGSIKGADSVFFIGRNQDYSLALEGALKLKEISYIHAEAYPAGELKHGTLALVEEGVPVFALMTRKKLAAKTFSNIEEVKARGGDVIAVSSENILSTQAGSQEEGKENMLKERGKEEMMQEFKEVIELPVTCECLAGVLVAVPLQLIAYYTARELDRSIDKPRNLAKSVTVE